MYLHCKNIFIGEQTLQTGLSLAGDNVRSQSHSEETREGGGVEGLKMEIKIKSQPSLLYISIQSHFQC